MNRPGFEKPVIFFDGVCGLCNGFVDFVLKKDLKKSFFFAPLQGDTAAAHFIARNFRDWSIAYVDTGGTVRRRSDAVIKILEETGGAWRFAVVLRVIPAFIRDYVYSRIAAKRYVWFGRFDSCRLPPEEFSDRFLP